MEYEFYHYGIKGMKWGVRRAKRYKEKMLIKSKKKADTANKYYENAKYKLKDLKKYGKKSRFYNEFDYETLNAAKADYLSSVKTAATVGKTWMNVNNTLSKLNVNEVSKKEMTKIVKNIIEKGKKEGGSWAYY